MASNKPQYIKGFLKGVAKYPRLNEPDTKFNAAGSFSVKQIVSEEVATPLMEVINSEIDKAFNAKIAEMKEAKKTPAQIAKVKKADPPFVECYDEDGELTGEVEFNCKMNHTFTDKKTGKVEQRWPQLVDSKGNVIKGKKPSIWGGSVLTVAYQLIPFDSPVAGVGCSIRIQGVQINKLVTGGGGVAFGADGDYEPDDEDGDEPSFPKSNPEAGDGSDNPDF